MRKVLPLAGGIAVLCVASVFAEAPCSLRPQLTVPLAERLSLVVDGRADESEWAAAPVINRIVSAGLYSPEGAQSSFRVLADEEALYLFAELRRLPSTTRATKAYDRDKLNPSDVIEVLFKPDDRDRQYHFMFDAKANVFDAYYTYFTGKVLPRVQHASRNVHHAEWTAEDMVLKTAETEDAWTCEVRMPWAALEMSSPRPGTRLKANFCRGDYGNGITHNQLSQWALMKLPDFADWRDWGELVFAADPVRVCDAMVLSGAESVRVALTGGASSSSVQVVVEELDADGELKRIGEKDLTLPAHAAADVEVPLEEQTMLSYVSVFADGKLVYRRGGRPDGKLLMIAKYDPLNVRKGRIFIPNDANWYTPFQITHTLTGKTGNRVYGNPPDLAAKIIAEVPEGVSVTKVKYSDWGGDSAAQKPISEEAFVRDGKPWTRYELPAYVSGVNHPLVFFRSTLPAGATGAFRLYMTWKGGREKPVDKPFKVVSFGRLKPFERMFFKMIDLTFNGADAIAGDEPMEELLPQLGINVFDIRLFPSRHGNLRSADGEAYAARLKRFLNAVRQGGPKWYFQNAVELNGLAGFANDVKNPYGMTGDSDARYLRIDGSPAKSQFLHVPVCPSYRGRNFDKYVDYILSSEAVKDYGVTWINLDWEDWVREPCYCARCRKIFREKFLPERGLPDYGDPCEFMSKPARDPAAELAWSKFDTYIRGTFYADIKRRLDATFDPNRTYAPSPHEGGFALSDYKGRFQLHEYEHGDPNDWVGIAYHHWSIAYYAPWMRQKDVEQAFGSVLGGTGRQFVVDLMPMQGEGLNPQWEPICTFYNMAEALTAGVRGFEWYYVPLFDAETWKYVLDALRAVRPYENLIQDGKVTIRGDGENCSWRRVEKDGESIWWVRNYELTMPVEASFAAVVNRPSVATDLLTGETLGELKPGANRIAVSLAPERMGRLIHIKVN